jgi:hypothetical protein
MGSIDQGCRVDLLYHGEHSSKEVFRQLIHLSILIRYIADPVYEGQYSNTLKVVGNEKVGESGMCQTVPIWLGPRRSRLVSLSILPSSLILSISVSAPVKQNE